MCFENFCWSDHGVQIERYRSLENILWVYNIVILLHWIHWNFYDLLLKTISSFEFVYLLI